MSLLGQLGSETILTHVELMYPKTIMLALCNSFYLHLQYLKYLLSDVDLHGGVRGLQGPHTTYWITAARTVSVYDTLLGPYTNC